MRVYISADMEGIAGVANLSQTVRGAHGYAAAQLLMAGEVNAAIEGAFEAGASSVVVNDGHGTMDNLLPDKLDPRAELVLGAPKALCMAQGLSSEFDVAFFIGYHAAAGSTGLLAHSFSSHFCLLRLNGAPVSEADVNGLYAASCGVPVGLISGDEATCRDAAGKLPGLATAAVKSAAGWGAAQSLHPDAARAFIRGAARDALKNIPATPQVDVPAVLVAEVDMAMPTAADLASQLPGAERMSAYRVRHQVESVEQLLGLITIWTQIAGLAARDRLALIERR